MQKIIVSMAAIAILLSVAACGGGGSDPSSPRTVAEALSQGEKAGIFPLLNRDDTIAGPDLDNNGVRDDMDAYIDSLPDTPQQKAALRQSSAAIRNSMLVDTTSQSERIKAMRKIMSAAECVTNRYGPGVGSRKGGDMEKFTVNTMIRLRAYEKFNASLNGMSFSLPEGDGCEN